MGGWGLARRPGCSHLFLFGWCWWNVGISNLRVAASSTFEPYEMNGGLVAAVAGKDYCIIATDTRMSSGYQLKSRNHLSSRLWGVVENTLDSDHSDVGDDIEDVDQDYYGSMLDELECNLREGSWKLPKPRRYPISESLVFIGSSGCNTDCLALKDDMRADLLAARSFGQVATTTLSSSSSMTTSTTVCPSQVATRLSQLLYHRRNFPYYAFCIVAGLDGSTQHQQQQRGQAHGKVYVYDAIGSYERVAAAATGSGRECLQPILDRLFTSSPDQPLCVQEDVSSAVQKLVKAYRSVTERAIEVGDKLVLVITERSDQCDYGICRIQIFPLKED